MEILNQMVGVWTIRISQGTLLFYDHAHRQRKYTLQNSRRLSPHYSRSNISNHIIKTTASENGFRRCTMKYDFQWQVREFSEASVQCCMKGYMSNMMMVKNEERFCSNCNSHWPHSHSMGLVIPLPFLPGAFLNNSHIIAKNVKWEFVVYAHSRFPHMEFLK